MREARCWPGSEPNGILYRITAQNKAFVLYDANLPEIRAIVPAADGNLYAAALGGSVARRIGSANSGANGAAGNSAAPVVATVTVTDQQARADAASEARSSQGRRHADSSDGGFSRDGRLRGRRQIRAVHDSSGQYGRDAVEFEGRKYLRSGDVPFVAAVRHRLAGAHLPAGSRPQSDAGGAGERRRGDAAARIARSAARGDRQSREDSAARFGTRSRRAGSNRRCTIPRRSRDGDGWLGAAIAKGIAFKTRSGNSLRPDATWSDWSEPMTDPDHAQSPARTRATSNGAPNFREVRRLLRRSTA